MVTEFFDQPSAGMSPNTIQHLQPPPSVPSRLLFLQAHMALLFFSLLFAVFGLPSQLSVQSHRDDHNHNGLVGNPLPLTLSGMHSLLVAYDYYSQFPR